jgi:sulfur carrier protein ThiS adenylyltransferase
MVNSEERYSRQKDIISLEKLESLNISIIGVGAIGRNVALMLTSIGANKITLIDFDTVEESNIASQGYLERDIGSTKVEATKRSCKEINSEVNITCINDKFKRSLGIGDVVFLCVDSITTRKFIWETIKDNVQFFVDGRMSAEVFRILTVDNALSKSYYPTTLFTEAEAFGGSCTAKSTIYCASTAASQMISSFTKWLREFPCDKDVLFNMLTCEINVE